MSFLVTRELAERATTLAFNQSGFLIVDPKPTLHVVVLDPSALWACNMKVSDLDRAIIFKRSYNLELWRLDFNLIALGKAAVSWRTRLNTGYVVQQAPWLLLKGEPKYAGGVYLDGIVVGVSGLDEWQDEALGMAIAMTIRNLAIAEMQIIRAEPTIHLLGEERIPG